MIVSNASPLIIFTNINKLDLIQNLFEEVYVPKVVYREITEKRSKIKELKWTKVKDIKNKELANFLPIS